jgi:protein-disulfide isomerase
LPLLEQVLERYPNDVKIAFKNFPLRNHKLARPAATAALAAGEQGKFWEFHDELFKNYNRLSDAKFREIAETLNLDVEQFEADRKNQGIQTQIFRDLQDGQRAGVRGTPTVFINGRLLKNRNIQGFQGLIDRLLQQQGPKEEQAPESKDVKKASPGEGS